MASVLPSIRGGVVEQFAPGDRITMTVKAGQSVSGGRLVEITANREIQHAASGSRKVLGVALYDGAAGDKVTVATEGVWLLLAKGAISAGDSLVASSDANGSVAAVAAIDNTSAATVATSLAAVAAIIGKALEAIADGATGPVKLGGMI